MHADSVLENICAIGLIDGDALRLRLQRQGFDDARRSELQKLGSGIVVFPRFSWDHSDLNPGFMVKFANPPC